jgi:hypothetical protein
MKVRQCTLSWVISVYTITNYLRPILSLLFTYMYIFPKYLLPFTVYQLKFSVIRGACPTYHIHQNVYSKPIKSPLEAHKLFHFMIIDQVLEKIIFWGMKYLLITKGLSVFPEELDVENQECDDLFENCNKYFYTSRALVLKKSTFNPERSFLHLCISTLLSTLIIADIATNHPHRCHHSRKSFLKFSRIKSLKESNDSENITLGTISGPCQ